MRTILLVRQGGTDFFVLAEKNFVTRGKQLIDYTTKRPFDSKELCYALTKIKDGKPKEFIGYVSDISSKVPCSLRIPAKANCNDPKKREFKLTSLYIIEKVYDFD